MPEKSDRRISARRRELGRGERILPGVFRLRLPLPWPGIPHCNAWAVAAADGIVLFDTGMCEPGSFAELERALAMCGLSVEQVRLLVCTHAHADHYGQAATIVERSGAELWMHPDYRHMSRALEDPEGTLAGRLEVARQSGVPTEVLRRYAAESAGAKTGIAGFVRPDRDLVDGVLVETDLGPWRVYETPGHAPSHVCLLQPQQRLLISGDHLLGRISQFFEYGYTPDPVGEFLRSLRVVEELDARLCLPGHGRTFADVGAHIEANREVLAERLGRVLGAIVDCDRTAFELLGLIYGEVSDPALEAWLMVDTLALLTHLQRTERAQRVTGEVDRWRAI